MGERQTPENDAACRIEDGVCFRHTPNNPTCVLHAPDSTPTEREAGDVRCTCANDGNASRCPLHTQADYDASARAGDVGEVELTGDEIDTLVYGAGPDADHDRIVFAVERIIAERERAAGARALREAAYDWQASLWPLGVVSWLRRRAHRIEGEA